MQGIVNNSLELHIENHLTKMSMLAFQLGKSNRKREN